MHVDRRTEDDDNEVPPYKRNRPDEDSSAFDVPTCGHPSGLEAPQVANFANMVDSIPLQTSYLA
jgi:hypothetical protein